MIKSLLVIHLLVFLILDCHSRQVVFVMASLYSEQNAATNTNSEDSLMKQQQQTSDIVSAIESEQQQQRQQQQRQQFSNSQQENLKRFLLKDLNLDGYTSKPTLEQWRLVRLNQLLDSLSSSIPPSANEAASKTSPIYRGGRTFPSLGLSVANIDASAKREMNERFGTGQQQSNSPFRTQQSLKPIIEYEPIQQQQQQQVGAELTRAGGASGLKKTILGISWPQSRPSYFNARRSQINSGPHLIMGTEETALHTPKHSRSVNPDYEWKRVENSRWNNLRGMWGKRGANSDGLNQEVDVVFAEEEDLNRRPMGDE